MIGVHTKPVLVRVSAGNTRPFLVNCDNLQLNPLPLHSSLYSDGDAATVAITSLWFMALTTNILQSKYSVADLHRQLHAIYCLL